MGWSRPSASNYLNVKTLGAKGDGVIDDTVSIQNTITYAAANGLVVYFPKGIYMIRGLSLPSGTVLEGVPGLSTLKLIGGMPTNTYALYNSSFVNGNSNIWIVDMIIDGNSAQQTLTYNVTSLQFQNVTGLNIIRGTVTGGIAEGGYFYKCTLFIEGTNFNNNGQYQQDGSGIHIDTCTEGRIIGVTASGNGFHGLLLNTSQNIKIIGLYATNNGFDGMRVDNTSYYNVISGCDLYSNNQRGLYVKGSSQYNLFESNSIWGNAMHGIAINVATDNNFTGNVIRQNAANGFITVSTTDNNFAINNIVEANTGGDYSLASLTNLLGITQGITGTGSVGSLTVPWGNLTSVPNNIAKKDTANTWAALQTFNAGITGVGSVGALTMPWGNLTGVPADLAKKDVANTWTALQTFNTGITGVGSVGALTMPWGNLTSVPADLAKKDVANTWSAVQTFNAGVTIGEGISATSVIPNNFRGINEVVNQGDASTTINFSTAEPDASYALFISPSWATSFGVSKKAGYFIVTWGTPAADVWESFDWMLIR
jgi:parallel beta-helix repeat protein